jgi:hypothetical protein
LEYKERILIKLKFLAEKHSYKGIEHLTGSTIKAQGTQNRFMTDDKTEEEFTPEDEDIGIIGEITGKNSEGLEKLASEEQSKAYRDSNKYFRRIRNLYRKYVKRSRANTQTIEA